MIFTKDDFQKKETNKKYNKNNNYLIKENKNLNDKYENKYFHKRNVKNIDYSSLKDILNDRIISKNDKNNNQTKTEIKKTSSLTINDNIIKRTNINSVTTRNKFIRNQNKNIIDNIRGMETEYEIYNKVNSNNNNNLYSTINETKKNKQKNTSMEQRYRKNDDEILTNEYKVDDVRQNQIYSRPYKYNASSSKLQKNFENQFNIKDAKNILNINYFYDKSGQNLEDMDQLFYTNYYNEKYRKRIKVNNKNKYNSLIMNDGNEGYQQKIPSKTIHSFYIRKNPINLINNNIIIKDEISNKQYFNRIKYVETEEQNRIGNNKPRHHSMVERYNMNYTPDRFYINTLNNYINNKGEKSDKKIIRRNGNKIKIFKKNNNTSIQEYNLSLGNDENDSENDAFDININDNELINNQNKIGYIFTNNIIKRNQELNDINKYYKYFTKNIRPIITSQFSIKNNNKSKLDLPKKNFINVNKVQNTSVHKRKIISNKKNYDNNINFVGTPNFSDAGKTPKNNNNINLYNKKIKTLSFNEKKETELIRENQNKKTTNDIFKICKNEYIEIINKKNSDIISENKFVFKTEEDIVDYVYKKFEEERKNKSYFNRKLRFTGFILTKKYKGKNLVDIRIEDDIDQINQKLKDENVLVNEKNVKLIYDDDLNKLKNLEVENKKLKEEIENLRKKQSS